jgi:hypothetical protein
VTGFPNEIYDGPVVFATLDQVKRKFDQFSTPQPASK